MRNARGWVVMMGAVVWLGGCGGSESTGSVDVAADPFCEEVMPRVEAWLSGARAAHPVPPDPRYGGAVTVGSIGEINGGMNAFISADYAATQHQQFVNLMTLVEYDEDFMPRPYLAESWVVSGDGTEIIFRLRDDVYWHDGERTDAHDVAFTYVRLTDPATGYPNAAFWDHYVKGPDGVEVVDDFTVRILLEPHSDFMDVWRTVAIMPEHLLADVPPEELRGHAFGTRCPVGNGPFVFREHREADRWVFDANPAFPAALGGRPYVDRYIYRVVPDQATLLAELLAGGIDVFVAPRPDQVRRIEEHEDLYVLTAPSRNYIYVGWNARRPQLADARVRRALTLGTNRQEIVDVLLRGYGTVAHSSVPPFHWAYDPGMGQLLPYAPDAARSLLEEAGWTDRDGDGVREDAEGTRLRIGILYNHGNQLRQNIVEAMQAQLAQVGVEIVPEAVEWNTVIARITSAERAFDGVIIAWITEFRVDDTDLFHSSRREQPYGWAGLASPKVDALLERLAVTADREAARPLWVEYQHALAEEQPYTFLYYPDWIEGVNRRLRDMRIDPRGEWVNIRAWWLDRDVR